MTPERIKAIRSGLGLTQRKFAALVGCCIESLQRWEQGRTPPGKMSTRRLEEIETNGR